MKFEVGHRYVTRNGCTATITQIERGIMYGNYLQKSGAKKSTVWNSDGRHAMRKSPTDIVAQYRPPEPVKEEQPRHVAAPAVFVAPSPQLEVTNPFKDLTMVPDKMQCEGFVAVFKSNDGSTFPFYKSFAQPDYGRFQSFCERKQREGHQLMRTTYVREVRMDDEDLVA